MRRLFAAFLAGLIVMAGAGYFGLRSRTGADGEPLPIKAGSFLHPRTTVAVGEVVNDIRPLDRLVVFRAYLTATSTTHEVGWVTRTDQTMLTPAYVNFYVDMGAVTARSVQVRGDTVFVALPPLMIERPNIDTANVRIFNAGLWSNLSGTSERLRLANSRMALRQLLQRARMPFLVDAARRAAVEAVTANVGNALAAKGHGALTVRVVA